MKDNGIEDIVIGEGYNSNKKGKKGIVIIFIILLLILVGMVGAYFYFIQPQTTTKDLFVKNFLGVEVDNVLDNKIYNAIINRMLTEDFEMTTSINYTSALEEETLEGLDLSKFILELTNKNDISDSKSYSELNVNYSGNEVFKVKLLSNKEAVAIKSDDIVNKYVGVKYNSISDMTGININSNFSNLKKMEEITLADERKKLYLDKYMTQISKNIPEDKFTMQDNYVIQKEKESSSATAYTLKLSQEELNTVLVELLTTFRNDEELLNELVTGKEESKTLDISPRDENEENNELNIENQENDNTENGSPELNLNPNEEETKESERNANMISNTVSNNSENTNNNEVQDTNVVENNAVSSRSRVLNVNQSETAPEDIEDLENQFEVNPNTINLNPVMSNDEKVTGLGLENLEVGNDILKLLLGNKINTTVVKLQENIDKLIEQVKKLEGNGLTLTIYVTDLGTEKINAILPNEDTLDIEITKKSVEESVIKLTYLYKDGKQSDVHTYSAEDELDENEELRDNQETSNSKNGFSLEFDKIKKEANTSIKATYNVIENEKITRKINVDLKTDGTSNSKNIKNSLTISLSAEDTQSKQITFDNTIKFSDISEIEDLTLDNCVFLDELSPEEQALTIEEIKNKIELVYNEKKENMSFIDTNTHSSLIQQNINNASSNVSYDEARQALIDRVSDMMTEAIEKNEEFTIQNLVDLTIDGYEVKSVVNDKMAVIVVDVYTFNIDTEFNLTDAQ